MFVSCIKSWVCLLNWIQRTHAGYDAPLRALWISLLYNPFNTECNSWGEIQNLMGGKKKLPTRMDTANC